MGQANLSGDMVVHGFFWERGVLTDLGSLFGGDVEVWWMNDIGEIVGSSKYPGGNPRHAFLWKKGVMTDLATLYPKCNVLSFSVAYGANSKEQIVGSSGCDNPPAYAAFLWEKGGPMVDLNTLIPPNSGMQLVLGFGINEGGEIAGVGYRPNGDARAFLLIPCGEGNDGCQGESPIGLTQKSPVPATQQHTVAPPGNPAHSRGLSGRPATMLDRLRSRWGQRYRIPSPGTGPTN